MTDAAGTRPNIVLINCDDLGYGDLGCYGSELNDTPALDRMATEGMRFTDFYVASPVCSPSRGSMLTGCYPPRIGFGSFEGLPVLFPGQPVGLAPGETTMARLLSDAGYDTLMVGKWHCGDQPGTLPTDHGFDRYLGLPYSNDMGRQVGTFQLPDGDQPGYPPLPLLDATAADGVEVIEQQPEQAGLTTRYLAEVVRFLREDRDRPFFVYFAHMYVHLPIYVQSRFAESSRNGRYGAAVGSIDWVTAVIMSELERLGIDDDTVVVFMSDNGALDRGALTAAGAPVADGDAGSGSNLPMRGAKGSTFEGGLRVPAIVRWPGRVPAGSVCGEVVTAMDLLPTFASVAGAAVPADRVIDGRDISPVLFDGAGSPHEAFAYYWMEDLQAVRSGRWKLHLARGGAAVEELYDLEADVAESDDVAASRPEVVARLHAIAEGFRSSLGDRRLGVEGGEVRPVGRVDAGVPLTRYDPTHPYYAAEYDLVDRG